MKIFNSSVLKSISLILLLTFFVEVVTPLYAWAQTPSTKEPESKGTISVSQSTMVDPFTGQLKYDIPIMTVPGPHGSGYPLTLSYNSNFNPMSEASWVGFGWNLNAGSINRIKHGVADDMDGSVVEHINRLDDYKTWTSTTRLNLQARDYPVGAALSATAKYNNYEGWGLTQGLGIGAYGVSYELNCDKLYESSWSIGLNIHSLLAITGVTNDAPGIGFGYKCRADIPYRSLGLTNGNGTSDSYLFSLHVSAGLIIGPSAGLEGSLITIPVNNNDDNAQKQYGFMYLHNSILEDRGLQNKTVMDYYLEKDKGMRTKKQPFLSMPFPAPDIFSVSSAGQRGTFRLFRTKTGAFRRPHRDTKVDFFNYGFEGVVGVNIGVSFGLDYSRKTTHFSEWAHGGWQHGYKSYYGNDYSHYEDYNGLKQKRVYKEPYKFLFVNDMASSVRYSATDNPISFWNYLDDIDLYQYANRHSVIGGTTNISYNTIRDMAMNGQNGRPSIAWNKNINTSSFGMSSLNPEYSNLNDPFSSPMPAQKTRENNRIWEKSLGEFALTNADGSIYVYGLPVYSRNEEFVNLPTFKNKIGNSNLLFSNDNNEHPFITKTTGTIYTGVSKNSALKKVMDEKNRQPYATNFLLTEIHSSDYIDETGDGPTPDDRGGYTVFHYSKAYGTNTDPVTSNQPWYQVRSPYSGMYYNRGKLSNPRDDMASVATNEKEIYYLESIETKTHIAYFVTNLTNTTYGSGTTSVSITGSGIKRLDGFPASGAESAYANGSVNGITGVNDNKLRVLEEVRLYSKENISSGSLTPAIKLVKKARFAYTYDLMPEQPNSWKTGSSAPVGKLTLKQLWFESEGTHSIRISPYKFIYEYPSSSSTVVSSYSTWFTGFASSSKMENPPFKEGMVNRWGGYQEAGNERISEGQLWVDQTPSSTFDPAAWHLKSIQLPTGGEIYIQYEQNDYLYVQDKKAHIMAPILKAGSYEDNVVDNITELSFKDIIMENTSMFKSTTDNRYYLNLSEIGITTQSEAEQLRDEIITSYINTNERIYFKFLYKFGEYADGQLSGLPWNCNHEYINGYTTVRSCSVELSPLRVYISLGKTGFYKDKPMYGAVGFLRSYNVAVTAKSHSQAMSLYNQPDDNITDYDDEYDHDGEEDGALGFMGVIAGYIFTPSELTSISPYIMPHIIFEHSYLRVPVIKPKLGGTVRVKRILMYNPDDMLETGSGALFGTEYYYIDGVATTEPNLGREENSLVRPVAGSDGELPNEIIAGDDIIHFEGPLGETLLPSPGIGYKHVVIQDINVNSNSGHAIYHFNTCNDRNMQSVVVSQTELLKADDGNSLENILLEGFTGFYDQTIAMSQGFSVKLNNMHGTVQSVEHCLGRFTSLEASSKNISSSVVYEYFDPEEAVPVMYAIDKPFRMRHMGQQMDLAMDSRKIDDDLGGLKPEFSVAWFPLFLIDASIALSYTNQSTDIFTHAISKVVSNPTILKKVTTFQDNTKSVLEYIAFDPLTGTPVVTRTFDSYANHEPETGPNVVYGDYYSYTVAADKYHPSMGDKAQSEHYIFAHAESGAYADDTPSRLNIGGITTVLGGGGLYSCTISEAACEGSTCGDGDVEVLQLYHMLEQGDQIMIHESKTVNKVFTVNSKVLSGASVTLTLSNLQLFPKEISFPKMPGRYLEILKSGRENHLAAPAYSIVTRVFETDGNGKTPVTKALDWAKDLAEREKHVDALNSYLERQDIPDNENANLFGLWYYRYGESSFPFVFKDCSTGSTSDFYCSFKSAHNGYVGYPPRNSDHLGWTCIGDDCIKSFDLLAVHVSRDHKGKFYEGTGYYTVLYVDKFVSGSWLKLSDASGGTHPGTLYPVCSSPTSLYAVDDDGNVVISPVFPDAPYLNGAPKSNFQFRTSSVIGCTGVPVYLTSSSRVNAFPDDLKNTVIAAGATTMQRDADYPYHYRPLSSYTYTELSSAMTGGYYDRRDYTTTLPRNRGTFTLSNHYDFFATGMTPNPDWKKLTTVEQYNEDGNPTVVKSELTGTHSVTGYSHNRTMPAYSAVVPPGITAPAAKVYYSSFEDQTSASPTPAHSGSNSLVLAPSMIVMCSTNVATVTSMDFIVEFWSKCSPASSAPAICQIPPSLSFPSGWSFNSSFPDLIKIATTGEWTLYRGYITASSPTVPLTISFSEGDDDEDYIDDLRVFPKDAEMSCFAYDAKSSRMVAQFDRNHFGTYMQYDGEGKMVRTIVETERGYKTVAEAHGHIPLQERSTFSSGSILTSGASSTSSQLKFSSPRSSRINELNQRALSAEKKGNRFDVIDLNISTDKKKIKVFGVDVDSVRPTLEQMRTKLPEIQNNLPTPDGLRNKADTLLQPHKKLLKDSIRFDTSSVRRSIESKVKNQQPSTLHYKK